MVRENKRQSYFTIPEDISDSMEEILDKYTLDWNHSPGVIKEDTQDAVLNILVDNDTLAISTLVRWIISLKPEHERGRELVESEINFAQNQEDYLHLANGFLRLALDVFHRSKNRVPEERLKSALETAIHSADKFAYELNIPLFGISTPVRGNEENYKPAISLLIDFKSLEGDFSRFAFEKGILEKVSDNILALNVVSNWMSAKKAAGRYAKEMLDYDLASRMYAEAAIAAKVIYDRENTKETGKQWLKLANKAQNNSMRALFTAHTVYVHFAYAEALRVYVDREKSQERINESEAEIANKAAIYNYKQAKDYANQIIRSPKLPDDACPIQVQVRKERIFNMRNFLEDCNQALTDLGYQAPSHNPKQREHRRHRNRR